MTTLMADGPWLVASFVSALLVGGILRLSNEYEAGEKQPMASWEARRGRCQKRTERLGKSRSGWLSCASPTADIAEMKIMKRAIWAVCSCAAALSLFAMVRAMEPARLAQKLHSAELAVLDLCLGWIVLVGAGWLFTRAAWTLAKIRDRA